jgi:hypothetical protein
LNYNEKYIPTPQKYCKNPYTYQILIWTNQNNPSKFQERILNFDIKNLDKSSKYENQILENITGKPRRISIKSQWLLGKLLFIFRNKCESWKIQFYTFFIQYLHLLYSISTPYIYSIYTFYIQYLHLLYSVSTPSLFSIYSLYIQYLHPIYTVPTPSIFSIYTL